MSSFFSKVHQEHFKALKNTLFLFTRLNLGLGFQEWVLERWRMRIEWVSEVKELK